MAIQAEQQAEVAFNSHDWSNDPAWTAKLSQVFISNAADQHSALNRLKRKYFKSEINPHLSLDPPKGDLKQQTSDAGSSSGSFDVRRKLSISANYICLFLHTMNLIAAMGYLFSFSSARMASSCFRVLFVFSLITSVLQIFIKYGKPRRELSYAQLVLADEQSHFLLMYFSMLFAHPMFLAVVPVCVRSFLFASMCLDKALLPMYFPEYHRKLFPYMSVIQNRQIHLTNWLSQLDVALGFVLLLSLLSSARQPIVALLFWQYLRIRYMFSSSGKSALQNVGKTLDFYFLHPRSPAILQKLYTKIQDFAYSTVNPDQARSRQEQFQNAKCQIM